jgi:hypothetical protein
VSDPVPDEVLKQISEGSGRTYPHEGKAMALELIEFRKQRAAQGNPAAQAPPTPFNPWNGIP